MGVDPFPVCAALDVNGHTIQGSLTCRFENSEITITGLSSEIPPLRDVGISVEIRNSLYAGVTGTFDISLLRGGTQIIFDRRTDITGVYIRPSLIDNVSLLPLDSTIIQAKNKLMDYILTFEITNPLPAGSAISITIPSSFQLDKSNNSPHYIVYGLEDLSWDKPVGLLANTSTNVITINSFQDVGANQVIAVKLRLINPSITGPTGSAVIATHKDSTLELTIDMATSGAETTIVANESPLTYSITTQNLLASMTQASIEFAVTPSTTVPASAEIHVKFPLDFSIGAIGGKKIFY